MTQARELNLNEILIGLAKVDALLLFFVAAADNRTDVVCDAVVRDVSGSFVQDVLRAIVPPDVQTGNPLARAVLFAVSLLILDGLEPCNFLVP